MLTSSDKIPLVTNMEKNNIKLDPSKLLGFTSTTKVGLKQTPAPLQAKIGSKVGQKV